MSNKVKLRKYIRPKVHTSVPHLRQNLVKSTKLVQEILPWIDRVCPILSRPHLTSFS